MKILIGPKDTYQCVSTDKPVEGRYYSLTEYEPGTDEQNRAFHALLNAFWAWMFRMNTYVFEDYGIIYDLRTASPEEFKVMFKVTYGPGMTPLRYYDLDGKLKRAETKADIPDAVVLKWSKGEKWRVLFPEPISWANCTKRQRTDMIDKLLTIIAISGCDDKKVMEIIRGMEEKSMEREMDKMRRK